MVSALQTRWPPRSTATEVRPEGLPCATPQRSRSSARADSGMSGRRADLWATTLRHGRRALCNGYAADVSATITVFRPSGGYRDRARKYAVEVDGRLVGELTHGSELTIEVPSGHAVSVRARIDWTGSPLWRGNFSDGERARIEVAPKRALTALFDLFSNDGWIRIRRVT
jgi:hypothetical protein